MIRIVKILNTHRTKQLKKYLICTFSICFICGRPVHLGQENCPRCQRQLNYLASFDEQYHNSLAFPDSEELFLDLLASRPTYQGSDEEVLICNCPICRGRPDEDCIFKEIFDEEEAEYEEYAGCSSQKDENNEDDVERGKRDYGYCTSEDSDSNNATQNGNGNLYYDYSSDNSDDAESDDYLDDYSYEGDEGYPYGENYSNDEEKEVDASEHHDDCSENDQGKCNPYKQASLLDGVESDIPY